MSLTNPNKVITEERLSEFYQGILPYLGGMPEILANKFNKSDLYSTSEKMIGQWIDGKPIYQKTYNITSYSSLPQGDTNISLSLYNIDNFWMGSGEIHRMDGNNEVGYKLNWAMPTYNAWSTIDTVQMGRIIKDSDNSLRLQIRLSKAISTLKNILVTICYTKTTDSPVSIGNDTDYSTTEKIVGTWIDGKPIYQKTMIPTQQDGLNPNVWTDIGTVGVGTNVVDKVIKLFGVIHNADGTQFFDVPEANMRAEYVKTTDIIMVYAQAEWDYRPYFMTLQYTKTTD